MAKRVPKRPLKKVVSIAPAVPNKIGVKILALRMLQLLNILAYLKNAKKKEIQVVKPVISQSIPALVISPAPTKAVEKPVKPTEVVEDHSFTVKFGCLLLGGILGPMFLVILAALFLSPDQQIHLANFLP